MRSRLVLGSVTFLTSVVLGCSAGGGAPGDGLSSGSGASSSGGTIATGSGGSITTGSGGSGGGLVLGGGTGGGAGNSACDSTLEVVYRDFNESHPDFEMDFAGDVVRRQLVQAKVGTDHKPVFASSTGCPWKMGTALECDNWATTTPVITSAMTFAQWYNTTADVNKEITGTITLPETPPGSGEYVFDSAAFFPLGPTDGWGITPAGNNQGQNFLFTTEIHVQFGYKAGQKFTFRGDDDVWIFVNGNLALDLGSMHNAETGTIDFDAQAATLGITVGNSYPMDVFHAERHTTASNFKFTTNISCFTPVTIK